MFVEVEKLIFPIPFPQIHPSEQQLLGKLQRCRREGQALLGQAKMSDRQTVILLSYLTALLLRHASAQSHPEQQSSCPDEKKVRTIVFLTRTTQRRQQLTQLSEKVYEHFKRSLSNSPNSQAYLNVNNVLFKIQEAKIESVPTKPPMTEEVQQGSHTRKVTFCKISDFVQRWVLQREDSSMRSTDPSVQVDPRKEELANMPKGGDLLLVETNDMAGILEETMSVNLCELHLLRANTEYQKLRRFYSWRGERQGDRWRVSQYDRIHNEYYRHKKQQVSTMRGGYMSSFVTSDYQQVFYLVNFQTVGYLLSFFMVYWDQNKTNEHYLTLKTFIQNLCTKTFPNHPAPLRKVRRLFLSMMRKFPPLVGQHLLSYTYIKQVLYFIEKAVMWNSIFCEQEQSQGTVSRLMLFRHKVKKDSNMRLLSFDQRILLQIFGKSFENWAVLQNVATSREYFQQAFRPDLYESKIHYQCPKSLSVQKSNVRGFIVASTPNQEELYILSEKRQLEQIEDRKEDSEQYRQVIRAYGVLIHDLCEIVPDGVIVYFPSPEILRECRAEWERRERIYQRINKTKKIFEESDWERQNAQKVQDFKKYCHIGRGAVFFLSAHSPFAKFQTFYGIYSKCVIFVGVPYHPFPLQTDVKLKFLKQKDHFKLEDALRVIARCLSNCLNSGDEVKTVVLADGNFNRTELKKRWFPFIEQGNLNTLQVLDCVTSVNQRSSAMVKKREKDTYEDLIRRTTSMSI